MNDGRLSDVVYFVIGVLVIAAAALTVWVAYGIYQHPIVLGFIGVGLIGIVLTTVVGRVTVAALDRVLKP